MLLCNGGQLFEELREEDGGEDVCPIQRDGFGFRWRRALQDPSRLAVGGVSASTAAFVCEGHQDLISDTDKMETNNDMHGYLLSNSAGILRQFVNIIYSC